MKIQDLFENWGIKGIKVSVGFLSMDWKPEPEEQQAAWELYVELLTRITTQPIADNDGDEKTALESVFNLFQLTRELLKSRGRKAENFSKIAIIVLNQKIRPFTAKWHKPSISGGFDEAETRAEFRRDLKNIQSVLQNYAGMLAEMAGVETFHALDQGALTEL